MANMKITEMEGVGPTYGEKLAAAGVADTDTLLEKCKTPKDRASLAADADISDKLILRFANMADLYRIKGVGSEYAELLEAAGADTVPSLAQRNAENLHAKMAEINEAKNLTRKLPTVNDCTNWIGQAKELPRMLEY